MNGWMNECLNEVVGAWWLVEQVAAGVADVAGDGGMWVL